MSATPERNADETPSCPQCGGTTALRTGRHGRFYGCKDFPRCRGAVSYDTAESARIGVPPRGWSEADAELFYDAFHSDIGDR